MDFLLIAGGVVLSIIALILVVWIVLAVIIFVGLRQARRKGADFTHHVGDHPDDTPEPNVRFTGPPIWMGSKDYRGGRK